MDKALIIKKRKNIKGEDGHKIFSVRVKNETVASLDLIAQNSGRTRNELVNIFLEHVLENCVVEE